MNKHLILSAFFVAGLSFSAISAQNEVEKIVENNVVISETEIKMVQDLAQELEKKLADVTSEADLKALIEETKEHAFQVDETEKIFDAEFLKLAALGAVEGLVLPIIISGIVATLPGKNKAASAAVLAGFGMLVGGLSKALAGKIGSLPKAKLKDFAMPEEVIKIIVAAGAQVGIAAGFLKLSSLFKIQSGSNYFVVMLAASIGVPIATTTLWKRIGKRNAANRRIAYSKNRVIAHSNNN